jgi:hypothetical protein
MNYSVQQQLRFLKLSATITATALLLLGCDIALSAQTDRERSPIVQTVSFGESILCEPIQIDISGVRLLGKTGQINVTEEVQLQTPIPKGEYRITLYYEDTRHGDPKQQDQLNETWYAEFFDEVGNSVLKTSESMDLPASETTGYTDVGSHILDTDVYSIRGVHASESDKYNSIQPTTVELYSVTSCNDTEPPLISVLGDNPLWLNIGETFVDPGVTAFDNVDGDLTSSIVVGGDVVDESVTRDYSITYDVRDKNGNAADQQFRTVKVVDDDLMGIEGSIGLTLTANGEVVDGQQGPQLTAEDPVVWKYHVTNSGLIDLVAINIVHAQQVPTAESGISVCQISTLAPSESSECELTTVAKVGEFSFKASVTALTVAGEELTSTSYGYYSAEPGLVKVPGITKLTVTAASDLLFAGNLLLGDVVNEFSDNIAEGLVLSQIPAPGQMVEPDSSVSIVVSSGPQIVLFKVPSVVGLTQSTATDALVSASAVLGDVTFENSDSVADGVVISQNPAAGESVEQGSAVSLVLSDGPEIVINAVANNLTIQLDSNGAASLTPTDIDGGSTAIAGIASLDVSPNAFDCSAIGVNDVTLTVVDNDGKSGTAVSQVTIEDNIAPTVVGKDFSLSLNGDDIASVTGADLDNGTNDACGIDSLVVTPSTFSIDDVGENAVTLTATDVNGNSGSVTVVVTINATPVDSVSPEISILSPQNNDEIFTPSITIAGSASDDVELVSVVVNGEPVEVVLGLWEIKIPLSLGANSVTAVATDMVGNSSSDQIVVTREELLVESLTVTPDRPVLREVDATVQLSVIGQNSDGSVDDLTAADSGTLYQSSAPTLVSVSADGLITALSEGSGVITVTNGDNEVDLVHNVETHVLRTWSEY